ncbi:unnamed protein product [Symbiodinium sp. CCMP2456]|nr:unnamed protein product [Symbiodinium sp. CCMP2456]
MTKTRRKKTLVICVRITAHRNAAAARLNTLRPRGRDDAQEPRSPLLPTKAQEAQQARAEPRPQQERSPRAALATPLSGGCMHPIEEEQPKRRSSKEKKHRRSRAGRGEDFCIPGCSRSEEVEPPSIEDLEEGAPPVERSPGPLQTPGFQGCGRRSGDCGLPLPSAGFLTSGLEPWALGTRCGTLWIKEALAKGARHRNHLPSAPGA